MTTPATASKDLEPEEEKPHGRFYIISGATCAGKGDLKRYMMEEFPQISRLVTCTTREMREGEIPGVSYHYRSLEAFKEMEAQGKFYETKPIHGNWYGVLREGFVDRMRNGESFVVDIDVLGAEDFRKIDELKDYIVDIFVLYPDIETLKKRMLKRDGKIDELRISRAPFEQEQARHFRHTIMNDDLHRALADLRKIVRSYQG